MLTFIFFLAGIVSGALFVFSYIKEPRRLANGVLLLTTLLLIFLGTFSLDTPVARSILNVAVPFFALLILVGLIASIFFLLVNGVIVMRREGLSTVTLLPVITGLIIAGIPVFIIWVTSWSADRSTVFLPAAAFMALVTSAYFGFVFLSFITYGFLDQAKSKTAEASVILILGSKIFNGKVPPLLAARLDRALNVYESRKNKGQNDTLLICCGGQGHDEDRPEADAMADYLLEKGVPESFIRRENKSTSTRENLIFGSQIAAESKPEESMLISTNEYHAFRTSLLSRELGLDAHVVSAKTAKYYVPAAFIREFVAILRDYKWIHIFVIFLLSVFTGFLIWESLQMR